MSFTERKWKMLKLEGGRESVKVEEIMIETLIIMKSSMIVTMIMIMIKKVTFNTV